MRRFAAKGFLISAICFGILVLLSGLSATGKGQNQSQQDSRRPTPAASPTPAKTPRPVLSEPPPPILREKPPELPDPAGQEISEGDTIKVDTDLVSLNVRVIDRNNRPINNINQSEFRVYEDGVDQPIAFFSREEVPINYGLVVDTSGSMRTQIEKVIEAGKIIVGSNKRDDEAILISFIDSDKIEIKQDFTADKSQLEDALDDLYVQGGQTAVIDAVYLSSERVSQHRKDEDRRLRALILITDGEDRRSFYNQEQLFAKLREEDVQIFVIGFVDELDSQRGLIRKSTRDKAVALIERLAKESGGRAFYPKSLSELDGIANEIVRDLRTQYVLSYSPTNKAKDGTFRRIRVAVSDAGGEKRVALTRAGRTVPREVGSVAAPSTPTRNPDVNRRRTP